ncbi:MAG: hypothetical protein KGJ07_06935 [Patescibacteria group bacterium]|nr:hypothetical protein [Patescibacteria group bacterium]
MITIDNYPDKAKSIDFSALPDVLQKGNDYAKKVTLNFTSRTAYDSSPDIKKVIDMYFAKLESFLATKKEAVAPAKKEQVVKPKTALTTEKVKKATRAEKKSTPTSDKKPALRVEWVERIPEELRFMKRYIGMNGKTKTYDQLLSLINSLQRAILEKRIRKTSPYAKQVEYMQKKLINVYNERQGESVLVKMASATVKEFAELISKEKVYKSVQFIKRFIGLHGKTGVKEKAKKLYESLNRAVKKGMLVKTDKYAVKLNEIWKILGDFIKDENQTRLAMDKETLDGLEGLLNDCGCGKHENLDGLEEMEEVEEPEAVEHGIAPVNSMDFMNMKFNTIGLKGKWHDFMGDPAPGFTAMVFGRPKTGKSCLCVEFAGYLARNHGKVLYVAREEGLYATLQMKLHDKQVEHPDLFISDDLPDDLSPYDFIFLDSVTKLGFSPKDLDTLRRKNPGKSFIFVFQVTKDGHFRGRNEFQHDVDIVIEVCGKGKATQFGRYNQGGEIDIFVGARPASNQ